MQNRSDFTNFFHQRIFVHFSMFFTKYLVNPSKLVLPVSAVAALLWSRSCSSFLSSSACCRRHYYCPKSRKISPKNHGSQIFLGFGSTCHLGSFGYHRSVTYVTICQDSIFVLLILDQNQWIFAIFGLFLSQNLDFRRENSNILLFEGFENWN